MGLSERDQNLTAAAIQANLSEYKNALMRAKVASADSRLSALKVQLEEKEAALANATKGLTEHRQNLTIASIRANKTETENSLMRAKIKKADAKLSTMKLMLEGKDDALINANIGLTLQKQKLTAATISVTKSETENALLRLKIVNAEKMLALAK